MYAALGPSWPLSPKMLYCFCGSSRRNLRVTLRLLDATKYGLLGLALASLLALVGNDDAAQRAQLVTRPDVVIATPARLAHHLAHLTRVAADGGKKGSGAADGDEGGGGGGARAVRDALRTSV